MVTTLLSCLAASPSVSRSSSTSSRRTTGGSSSGGGDAQAVARQPQAPLSASERERLQLVAMEGFAVLSARLGPAVLQPMLRSCGATEVQVATVLQRTMGGQLPTLSAGGIVRHVFDDAPGSTGGTSDSNSANTGAGTGVQGPSATGAAAGKGNSQGPLSAGGTKGTTSAPFQVQPVGEVLQALAGHRGAPPGTGGFSSPPAEAPGVRGASCASGAAAVGASAGGADRRQSLRTQSSPSHFLADLAAQHRREAEERQQQQWVGQPPLGQQHQQELGSSSWGSHEDRINSLWESSAGGRNPGNTT